MKYRYKVNRVASFIFPVLLVLFRSFSAFSGEIDQAPPGIDSLAACYRTRGDSMQQFNEAGSFGRFLNGIKAAVQTDHYNVSSGYSYRNYNGYRVHSNEYAHTLDMAVQTSPSAGTNLQITGYYAQGREMRPGSLTKNEFEQDPYQADPRALNRDEKRVASKGQLDINYHAAFGNSLNQMIEISGFGRIENFTRSTKEYKIYSRYGFNLSAIYAGTFPLFNRKNMISVGCNLFMQPERVEEYENFSGQKSDQLEQLKKEKTNYTKCHFSDKYEIIKEKFFLEISGNYENVNYQVAEESLPSRADSKIFRAFTPEIGLNYILSGAISFHTSFGLSFKSPTDKELESFFPSVLYNRDLKAQTSKNFNAGMQGDLAKKDSARYFKKVHFQCLIFQSRIDNEIVPYEIYGDEFYRNAAKANRIGVDLEGRLEIFSGLSLSAGWSYALFTYKTYDAISLETDTTGNIVAIHRDFAGNSEPDNPRNNISLSLLFKHPAGKKTGIFAKAGYHYASGMWADDANTEQTCSYNLVNASMGADMKFGHFRVSVSGGVDNVFNRVYVEHANINSADRRFYDAGAPRSFFGAVNFGYVF